MSIRVAIAGVGNCANALVQGISYYRDGPGAGSHEGLMHPLIGAYSVADLEVVVAFDVDAAKVGLDVAEAIWAGPGTTFGFAEVQPTGVLVQRGPTLDGLGEFYREVIVESDAPAVDVAAALRASRAEVLVIYLPVGSRLGAEFYAEAALAAGVALVNAIPVFIASDAGWAARFTAAKLPLVGDDIKSQLGATITHRSLARLFEERGLSVDRTYQLNVGGNMDFRNMLERSRLESKRISKTRAVTGNLEFPPGERDVHIGPSDHVPWLEDRKVAYVRLEGTGFGGAPASLEYKLEVWDSPNSAGAVVDAIRVARIALDAGVGGPLLAASAYLMKSPPVQMPDPAARTALDEFIETTTS
ncbi:inositol-3-phosphate synthase [soil metagenome]